MSALKPLLPSSRRALAGALAAATLGIAGAIAAPPAEAHAWPMVCRWISGGKFVCYPAAGWGPGWGGNGGNGGGGW